MQNVTDGKRNEAKQVEKAQLRAARALIGWTQAQVAEAAGLSIPTIKRMEGENNVYTSYEAVALVMAVYETAGVDFIKENGGGAGVRLKKGKVT